MKTKHLFENGYYFISNKAVAKCFMFKDKGDCVRFKLKMDQYLGPLCDVMAYGLTHDEFQILVRLKSREAFEKYFQSKFGSNGDLNFIPETTYIFAQAMANLQSGYVKYFNYKYERDGGLMKSRYNRSLVESDFELENRIKEIHNLNASCKRNRIWTFRRKEKGFVFDLSVKNKVRSSVRFYKNVNLNHDLRCFKTKDKIYVRGHFDILPPKQINFKNYSEKVKNLLAFMFMLKI